MNTMTSTKCNHFFCILGGKNKTAIVRVEQTFPNGAVIITNCCPNDFEAFLPVIESADTSCTYNVINL